MLTFLWLGVECLGYADWVRDMCCPCYNLATNQATTIKYGEANSFS